MKVIRFGFMMVVFLSGVESASGQLSQFEILAMEAPATEAVVFLDHPGLVVVTIRSSLTSLNFSSNMEIVDERNDSSAGEYRIVLNPENQILTVNAPGFISEGIQLRGLQPNNRFYYSVEPLASVTGSTLPVVFRVQPFDAELYINDEWTVIGGTLQLSPGNHEIRIEREGYATIEETIEVSTENILFEYSLDEIDLVPVRITSNVPGARVSIDGSNQGDIDSRGGFGLFLFPGSYKLILTAAGYLPVDTNIEVSETGENLFDIQLQRNIGTVFLEIEPSDAMIRINGEIQSLTSEGLLELTPSNYELEISRNGYLTYQESFNLELGQRINREIALETNTGVLILDIDPEDARLEINRQSFERSSSIELAPGRYRIDVQKSGYYNFSETVELLRGEQIHRRIILEPQTGTLQFSVVPSDARVELRNSAGELVQRWEGLTILRDLMVGYYTLTVASDGFRTDRSEVEIQHNETLRVQIDLIPGADIHLGTEIVDVTSATGRVWMDRNLGASRTAISSTDSQAYGDLYQWGRSADGHQGRTSGRTATLSSSSQPSHGDFISAPNSPYDWRSPQSNNLWQGVNGINNPCPSGYRLPSDAEWEAERKSWGRNNASGAFNSPLRLPVAGGRFSSSGSLGSVGSIGYYWSDSVDGTSSRGLGISSSNARMYSYSRSGGYSVRCLKN